VLEVLALQGVRGEEAARLARWAGGSPGRALALRERGAVAFREVLEGLLSGGWDALAAARAVWEAEGRFEGKTPAARQRDQARAFLDLALDVTSDLLRAACGAGADTLPHGDVATGAAAIDEGFLRRALDALLAARADLERNLDAQVLVDEALLALGDRGVTRGAAR
jgi:hypothetical protein